MNSCRNCRAQLSPEMNFCPNCGKKIKDPRPGTSVVAQIGVYLVSFFLPPLGIWPAVKYLKAGGKRERKIGYAAIIITVISAGIAFWITKIIVDSVNQSLRSFSGLGL